MPRRFSLSAFFVAFLALAGCAGQMAPVATQTTDEAGSAAAQRPSSSEIEARVLDELKSLGEAALAEDEAKAYSQRGDKAITFDIPITINDQVLYFIDYFQTKIPKRFRLWLERSGRYIPMMHAILREYGLPEDLVYLSMIESGFSCKAYSVAHACGLWQFIKGTATRYGMKVDYWVDERRDPVKATHAAAKYLRDLHNEFQSWYLAAAAYNAGEAKIRRALQRYQVDDYWSLSDERRRYLKDETKQYVPKMIAAALIAKEPAKYGFSDLRYEAPLAYDEVAVHPGTSLSTAARLVGIESSELQELNPEIRRWATPPNGNGFYSLRIPQGRKAAFETAYAALPPGERMAKILVASHQVKKGETIARVARVHRISVADLLEANPQLAPNSRLKPGTSLVIPPSEEAPRRVEVARAPSRPAPAAVPPPAPAPRTAPVAALSSPIAAAGPHRNERKITHTVKKGDTIWDIAQTYGLSPEDIKHWNGGKSINKLAAGQKLTLYVPQAKVEAKLERKAEHAPAPAPKVTTYEVQKGDNLWKIAKRFKVSTDDLRRWNKLNGNSLTPGDRITVRKEGKS